jgi:hypothetical protein
METGFRTPLLDFFRRGDVARDVRLLAAQGALAPRAHEQLGLLVLLVADMDPDIAAAAESTLQAIPPASLAAFLARPDVGAELRSFFQARGIEPTPGLVFEADTPLVDTGAPPEEPPSGEDEQSVQQRIANLTVPQKVQLAMKGSREERAVLVRDSNKLVAVAVLSSPKLSETEVETIARMASISDEILRIIANTRAWVKNYPVVAALTKNPKTPLAVSMNLLPRLQERDLKMLSQDRNVPDVLRVSARQKVVINR